MALGGAMSLAGGIMGHNDAKRQAAARAAAIQFAQERMMEISQQEAKAYGKAGAIKQGELLAHLKRLADGQVAERGQSDADARAAQIAALAGPETAVGGISPGNQVASVAAGVDRGRAATSNRVDLARALLGSQDRARGYSARSADVAASRAVIPLQDRLYQLSLQRMQTQADLQAALGGIGPGWGGVAGQVLQGTAMMPMMFAA